LRGAVLLALAAAFGGAPRAVAAGESPHEQWLALRQSRLLDANLVAYYDFQAGDGGVLENHASSGRELDGVIKGATWTEGRQPGKQALRFDGAHDYVEIPHSGKLVILDTARGGSGELTIEAWINPTTSQEAGIVDKNSGGWGKQAPYGLWITAKKLLGLCGEGTNGQGAKDPVEVVTGVWQHLAFTVDAGNLRLYKNGVLITQTTKTIAPVDNGKPMLFGCMKHGLYFYKGLIDEIAIYDRALTSKEISRHCKTRSIFTFTIP